MIVTGGRSGICPKIWGPPAWTVLHWLSFRMKPREALAFYSAIGEILPCGKCRHNYMTHMSHLPFNKANIGLWVYRMHNRINAEVGDNTAVPPRYEDVKRKYQTVVEPPKEQAWVFLRCVVNTHPGAREASAEYVAALTVCFMSLSKYFGVPDVPVNYKSRALLKAWFKKNVHTPLTTHVCTMEACAV